MTTLLYIAAAAALPTAQFFAFALLLPTAMLCRLFLLAMSASAVSLCGAIIIEKAGM